MVRSQRLHMLVVLASTLGLAYCGGSDNGTQVATTGTVGVTVNADGSARAGVMVRLFPSGGATASATQTTGNDGRATFTNVPTGTHAVGIEVPNGFSLGTGEDDRKNVTVTSGGTANATFALVEDNPGQVVEIFLSGTSFSNDDVTIAPGTTVRWINQDGMTHTVTPDGHSAWTSTTLAAQNATFEHTFGATGTFNYFCQPHQAQGMTGVIRVQ